MPIDNRYDRIKFLKKFLGRNSTVILVEAKQDNDFLSCIRNNSIWSYYYYGFLATLASSVRCTVMTGRVTSEYIALKNLIPDNLFILIRSVFGSIKIHHNVTFGIFGFPIFIDHNRIT